MAVSEQELRDTIALMREQLRATAAARRTARVVSILGVVVGFCIVAFIVLSLFGLFKDISKHPEELRAAAVERIKLLQFDRKAKLVADELMPVAGKEVLALVKELDLPSVLMQEAKLMLKDLEPVARRELERATPRLQELLETERGKLQGEMQTMLEGKLAEHFSESIGQNEQRLARLNLTEEKVAQIIESLKMASADALKDVLKPRVGDVGAQLEKISELLEWLPPLPEKLSEQDLLEQLRDVLLTLVKHRLPEFEVEPGDFGMIRAAEPLPRAAGPAKVLQPEERRQAEEAIKRAQEEASKKAAEAAAAAAGRAAAAGGGQ